jgi:outer membrane protein assembly factor BamC
VDPASAGREEPNFFSKMFSRKKNDPATLAKYRVKVNSEGTKTTVAVLDSQGKAESGEAGTRIVNLLLEDLR